MFRKKINVSLLDAKWQVIQRNLKLEVIPRRDEFLWFNNQYYSILNVVHSTDGKGEILLIIEEYNTKIGENSL